MLDSSKKDRLIFAIKGVQSGFVLGAQNILGMNNRELSELLKISQRTLADWKRGKLNMSLDAANILSNLTSIPIPKNSKTIEWKTHLKTIGKQGGINNFAIHGKVGGDEVSRSKKWREWWNEIGKHKEQPKGFQAIMDIKIPKKDVNLAEFVGIMLGDGGVAPYHIHITLSIEEKEYTDYVLGLIKKLFGLIPKIHLLKNVNAIDIVVQRKRLVDFCQEIGLVKGNKIKQQVDIPDWIKDNAKFSRACLKGLIDTDGCFYTNSYRSNNRKYSYFKIAFTSASDPLLKSVSDILRQNGIDSRLRKRKNQKVGDVRIEKPEHVRKYIKTIGSHNKKHLDKISVVA